MAPSPVEATPALQEQPAAELLSSQQSCLLPGEDPGHFHGTGIYQEQCSGTPSTSTGSLMRWARVTGYHAWSHHVPLCRACSLIAQHDEAVLFMQGLLSRLA